MRKLLATIFCLLSLSAYSVALASFHPNSTYANTLTSGLIGYWTFDGQKMTATTALDSSGQGNTGTLNNSPGKVIGQLGQALNFTGTAAFSNVDAGTNTNLNTSQYSLSAWVNFNTVSGDPSTRGVIEFASYSGADSNYDMHWDTGGGGQIVYGYTSGGTYYKQTYAYVPAIGAWQHWVTTYDGAHIVLYINGVAMQTNAETHTPDATGTQHLIIGEIADGGAAGPFNGKIDDMRVYNRALSASEVTQLYNQQHSLHPNSTYANTLTAGLVGYWPFDGQYLNTSTSTDVSGRHNDASLGRVPSGDASYSPKPTKGQVGQALDFNNFNTVNLNYLSFPRGNGLPIYSTSTPFSVAVWAKWLSGSFGTIYKEGGSAQFYIYVPDTSGNIHVRIQDNTNPDSLDHATSNTPLGDHAWHHIVYTDNAGAATLYIDGVQNPADFTYSPETGAYTFTNVEMGAVGAGSANQFIGSLDDFRIYNRQLSASEVTQLYNQEHSFHANSSQTSTLTSGLVGMWDFNGNDTTATTATDGSGNGKNGTLHNGPTPTIGVIGQGLSFDGSDDYVSNSAISVSNNYTLVGWFYFPSATGADGYKTLIMEQAGDTGLAYRVVGGVGHLYVLSSGGGNDRGVIPSYGWHQYALTNSGGTGQNYFDGATLGSTIASMASISVDRVGGNVEGTFLGTIDDVRVYNRPLSATEINQLYSYGH